MEQYRFFNILSLTREIDVPRTVLPPQRLKEIKKQNIGQILIFCEGSTEYNYMNYFAGIVSEKADKFTNIVVELELAGGNARRVLKYAEKFMLNSDHNRKYSLYKKYLVFDCDAPKDIQSVINDSKKSDHEFELLVSNYVFETWLIMHYENISECLSKPKIYRKLEEYLTIETYTYGKKKNNKGIIRKIISNGDVDQAIQHARRIEEKYSKHGEGIYSTIKNMNPYSNVYKLIEQFMVEISE